MIMLFVSLNIYTKRRCFQATLNRGEGTVALYAAPNPFLLNEMFEPSTKLVTMRTYYKQLKKPLWSGMGEVVPARTSLTLHPPSPPTVHQYLIFLDNHNISLFRLKPIHDHNDSLHESLQSIFLPLYCSVILACHCNLHWFIKKSLILVFIGLTNLFVLFFVLLLKTCP